MGLRERPTFTRLSCHLEASTLKSAARNIDLRTRQQHTNAPPLFFPDFVLANDVLARPHFLSEEPIHPN